MGDWPSVTVVIAVLNAEATLAAQLEALAGQHYRGRWELVIADDGCTDASMKVAAGFTDRVPALRVVEVPQRAPSDGSTLRNDAHPKNRAVEAARGEIVLVCDADDVVQPGWIESMVEGLTQCDLAGGATDREALNSVLVNRWYWSPIARRRGVRPGGPTYGVAGGNMAVRKETWEALGGWSEDLVSADIDFVIRAEEAGLTVGRAPGAIVLVRRRSSLRAVTIQAFRRGFGAAQMRELHPDQAPAALSRRRLMRNVAFVAGAWPAALPSPGLRGYWLGTAAFLCGAAWGRLRYRRASSIGS